MKLAVNVHEAVDGAGEAIGPSGVRWTRPRQPVNLVGCRRAGTGRQAVLACRPVRYPRWARQSSTEILTTSPVGPPPLDAGMMLQLET